MLQVMIRTTTAPRSLLPPPHPSQRRRRTAGASVWREILRAVVNVPGCAKEIRRRVWCGWRYFLIVLKIVFTFSPCVRWLEFGNHSNALQLAAQLLGK